MEANLPERNDYTREEYIDLLEGSAQKMEYHDGQIVMRAVATGPHNRITMNLLGLLYDNPNDCEPHGSDQALTLPAFRKYVFRTSCSSAIQTRVVFMMMRATGY
jgi:Uma2 family endonuclease